MAATEQIEPPRRTAWERFVDEAQRRGLTPDELADERMAHAPTPAMLAVQQAFDDLADLRKPLRGTALDPVAVVRAGRRELERRGA